MTRMTPYSPGRAKNGIHGDHSYFSIRSIRSCFECRAVFSRMRRVCVRTVLSDTNSASAITCRAPARQVGEHLGFAAGQPVVRGYLLEHVAVGLGGGSRRLARRRREAICWRGQAAPHPAAHETAAAFLSAPFALLAPKLKNENRLPPLLNSASMASTVDRAHRHADDQHGWAFGDEHHHAADADAPPVVR